MTRSSPLSPDPAPAPTGAAHAQPLTAAAFPGQTFTLYAAHGRVYASNVRDKVIDLGELAAANGSGYRYELDGDGRATASGFESAEEALAHVASTVTFLYLDGQFTALADLGSEGRPDLQAATQIQVTLDRLGHAAPAIAADV